MFKKCLAKCIILLLDFIVAIVLSFCSNTSYYISSVDCTMTVNVPGLVSIVIFYLAILAIGIWAAWKNRNKKGEKASRTILIGRRDLGLLLGSFTMTASWVGGGFINGTAESIYDPQSGLVWTLAPFCYSLSVIVTGLLFAKKMREGNYLTMLDPFQRKFGKRMGGVLYLPALMGEIMYCAAILSALGGTLLVIVEIDFRIAVVISTGIALTYTVVGGFYSVAYTDVVQLCSLFVGMWLSVPFVLTNDAVGSISDTAYSGDGGWLGTWSWSFTGSWIDTILVMVFGGIPWQIMFQRVLSAESPSCARSICLIGGSCAALMAIPSVLIGASAKSTNWTMTDYMNGTGLSPADAGQSAMILPIVLQYLTPTAIAFVGLGAISAAVMSSVDATLLSAASMFTKNVYNGIFRESASDNELLWIMRISVVICGIVATVLALSIQSVYILWFLCSDFVYVLLFPQLLSVIYFDPNSYGSIGGLIIGAVLRIGGGEVLLNWAPFIHYIGGDNFPFKTFSMIMSLTTLNGLSYIVKIIFQQGIIPEKYDVFHSKFTSGGRTIEAKEEYEIKPYFSETASN
uniref:high-affinity choline transporter 1-like n=1 Tax=Styela clava TaxID=7725 RepID=UPI001939BA35|nr:high-affinity choline transporter 1-like [Styela clava]